MAATVVEAAAADAACSTEEWPSSTAPSAASSRSPDREAKEFLHGQVTNDIEALDARPAAATPPS